MCVCVRVCVCVYACVSARAGILHARAAAAAVPGGGELSALTRSRLEGDVKERRLRVIKPLRNVARTRNQAARLALVGAAKGHSGHAAGRSRVSALKRRLEREKRLTADLQGFLLAPF